MGIVNIHTLITPDDKNLRLIEAAHEEIMIEEHRKGFHPWGSMRRDCPLCNPR